MPDRAGRVRERRSRPSDGWLVVLLSGAPWWVTVAIAIVAVAVGASAHALMLGIVVAVVTGLAGLVAAEETLRARRVARASRSVDDLRRMSWEEFELVVAEAFRRGGYGADLTRRGGDGGVDIVLTKGNSRTFVQCKQNASRLGPGPVRELAGVMASEGVVAGIVVACGGVGDEGQAFARRNGIRIMEGSAVIGLLLETDLWTRSRQMTAPSAVMVNDDPSCPRCHAGMVRQVSSYGSFWGCNRFPSCRGTRPA